MKKEFKIIAEIIKKNTRVLDVGCGDGTLMKFLKENKNILIDLSLVSYIDSSGVASLVEGYQIAKKQSLKFGLFGVSDAAMSVLKLARLDQVFPIYNSKDEYEKEDV